MKVAAPKTIRVVLADDHDLVRSGLKALLGRIEGVEVMAEARHGAELITLVESLHPDLVVTDISMPGMDGISALTEIHTRHPEVRVLVVSMFDTVDFVKRAVANGANGYLIKDASPAELEHAVRSVMASGSYFSPAISMRLLQPSEPTVHDELTLRQIEILTFLAQGKSSKEIAYQLGLSSKTVDVHRTRIMERLRLHDLASLTLYAVRKGVITP